MTQQTQHLTETQISRYWEQDSGGGLDAERSQVEKHLEDCEPCLERLLHFQRTQLGLLESNLMSAIPHPECPGDDILQEIAAGLTSQEMAEYHTRHISMCNYCGPALKRYLHEFSTESNPDDEALLAQLETSTPKWQKEFVSKHVVPGAAGNNKSVTWGKARALWTWPKLIGFGAAAAAVLVVISLIPSYFRSGNDNQLVASVAQERRTTEMRLTSVPYSVYRPLQTTLGNEGDQGTGFDRPKLLAAKAEVGKQLESGANDPKVLQLEGEVALLEGTPRAVAIAKKALEDARDAGLDSPRLQIDLAAGNFEYEMKTHPEQPNLRKTIDLLQGIVDDAKLKSNDENRMVALFDLALAYEKSNQLDIARGIWEQYLQIDSSSPWASEARSHLEKLPRPKQQGKSEGNGAESDLYTAVTLWLPDAMKQPDGGSKQRLNELADLVIQEHSDFWLKDFLAALKPGSSQPVTELGAAVVANQQGRTGDALQHARHAMAGFARQHNAPGELRARYEEVYAYQRQLNGAACRARAGPLGESLNSTRYPWLQSQTALENAICLNFLGNYSTIDDEIARSRKIAMQANYSTLLMRTMNIAASIHRLNERKCDKAWRDAIQGIHAYWDGNYPPDRLSQFYVVLAQCAEQTENYHAAKALMEQTILINDGIAKENKHSDNTIVRAMPHLLLANILEALGDSAQAENEVATASSLLETTQEPTANSFKLAPRIRLAEIQMLHGKADIALSTLMPVQQFLQSTNDQLFDIDFYRVLGAIYFHLHDFREAESAYQNGIVLAENSLASLKDSSQRLQWTSKTEDLYKGLIRIWIERGRDQDAWKLWEWYRSRSMVADKARSASKGIYKVNWAELQQRIFAALSLSETEDRLVYMAYDDGVQVWAIHDQTIHPHWVSFDKHRLERLVNSFAESCATASSNLARLRSVGQELYTLLFAPISADLHTRVLTIELDRSLQNTLIEALPGPDGYIIQRFQVLYSPGVLVEKTLRKPKRVENNDLLVQLEGSGYVPGREAFRDIISNQFPRNKTIQGTKSSLSEIKSSLSISDVFNFIGHGEENGINTALRINDKPDELLLQSGDIPKALHHLKLATLSACSTGTSNDNGLLDTGNLANSFLAAGVPNVVASRWNVASDSTQLLIKKFYQYIHRGDNAVSALQKAQNELLKTNDHPYYWAGFYLAGRAN